MKTSPRIIAFMNSYSHGKSGGDMVFIETVKRMRQFKKTIITSSLGKDLCKKNGLDGDFIITTNEFEFKNVVTIYIKRIIKAFFTKLKPLRGDILLGTSDFIPDVLPIFFVKLKYPSNRWIQHVFHLIPENRKLTFLAQRLSFIFVKRLADTIIVDNSLLKNELISLGFEAKRISINYPGIDLDTLNKIKPDLKSSFDGVFMAQIRTSKGVFDLIPIWKFVTSKIPNARLAIIGKGDERLIAKIKQQIKNEKLESNIKCLGFLQDQQAFSIIKSSKLFIFPSHEEGFGIAPLEAQCLGVPVIAWDLPVFEEIFPKGMIHVHIGNHREFAKNVIHLLSHSTKHKKYSIDAKKNSTRFGWDETAKKEIEIFKEYERS